MADAQPRQTMREHFALEKETYAELNALHATPSEHMLKKAEDKVRKANRAEKYNLLYDSSWYLFTISTIAT